MGLVGGRRRRGRIQSGRHVGGLGGGIKGHGARPVIRFDPLFHRVLVDGLLFDDDERAVILAGGGEDTLAHRVVDGGGDAATIVKCCRDLTS